MYAILPPQKPVRIFFIFVIGLFLLTGVMAVFSDTGTGNLYVLQAEALLLGRTDIPEYALDVATYQGRYYVPFPPFPALLVLPFRAIFDSVNTTLLAYILTGIGFLTASKLLIKLGVDDSIRPWLLLAFFLGTGYWYTTFKSDGVWYFAHVVNVTMMLLAMNEAFGKGRGMLAGLLLGCAILTRQLMIYSSIFLLAILLTNQNNQTFRQRLVAVSGFFVAIALCALGYLYFNDLRFGSPFDTGYSYIENGDIFLGRFERFGLFSPAYVPFNLIYMFFQGPHIEFEGTLVPQYMDQFGTSITFASPFLISVFFARGNKLVRIAAWTSICLTLAHMLLYFMNGWVQVNTQRFALDFMPILLVLMALSMETIREHKLYFKAAAAYSVFLNITALVLVRIANSILSFLE